MQAMLEVPSTDTDVGLRDAALLELLYGTGLRISEAVALDVDDVHRLLRTPMVSGHQIARARQGQQGTDRAGRLVRASGP